MTRTNMITLENGIISNLTNITVDLCPYNDITVLAKFIGWAVVDAVQTSADGDYEEITSRMFVDVLGNCYLEGIYTGICYNISRNEAEFYLRNAYYPTTQKGGRKAKKARRIERVDPLPFSLPF